MKFLDKIRESDDKTKTKWVIGLSILAMVVLIYIWGAYFNFLVAAPIEDKNANEIGFLNKIKNGGAFVFETLKNVSNSFLNFFLTPKEYFIK